MKNWEEVIKACGKAIIDNADKIAGNYPYQTGVDVSFCIDAENREAPEIEVIQRFVPKGIVEKSITLSQEDNA